MNYLLMACQVGRVFVKATKTREQVGRGNLVAEDLFQLSCLPVCFFLCPSVYNGAKEIMTDSNTSASLIIQSRRHRAQQKIPLGVRQRLCFFLFFVFWQSLIARI